MAIDDRYYVPPSVTEACKRLADEMDRMFPNLNKQLNEIPKEGITVKLRCNDYLANAGIPIGDIDSLIELSDEMESKQAGIGPDFIICNKDLLGGNK